MNESMNSIYDICIIGSGPAGLSAALTLKLHNKNILWFGSNDLSEKVNRSEKIANYAGVEPVSGDELNEKFKKQMELMSLTLTDMMVTSIAPLGNEFMVLADNNVYNCKTILFAIGATNPKGIENEQRLLGYGVSYCATCDGFLYKEKEIAIMCGSKRYEHEVEYLASIANKVYLYCQYPDCNINLPNVEVVKTPFKAVIGDKKVEGIQLSNNSEIAVSGVFFLRNAVAPATILQDLEMEGPHIVVNRNCETNIAGVFAAGDCTGRPYQIAKAVGEGNVAAHQIVEFLNNH